MIKWTCYKGKWHKCNWQYHNETWCRLCDNCGKIIENQEQDFERNKEYFCNKCIKENYYTEDEI